MSELPAVMGNALKRVILNMLQHVFGSRAEFTRRIAHTVSELTIAMRNALKRVMPNML